MSLRKHEVPDELLSRLLANYQKLEDLIGENGLFKQPTKRLRCLGEVRRRFFQDVALHLHPRQLGTQRDLHLLGAHRLAVGALLPSSYRSPCVN